MMIAFSTDTWRECDADLDRTWQNLLQVDQVAATSHVTVPDRLEACLSPTAESEPGAASGVKDVLF